jgi:transposase
MKRLFVLVCLLAAFSFSIQAQEKEDGNKIVKARMENMRNKLKLTSAESKVFWTAYEQYLRSEVKAFETYKTNLSKRGIKLNSVGQNKEVIERLNDSQLTYLHDQKFELRKNLLNLESGFYKKIKGTLTPRHIQEFFDIDEKFKRDMASKKKAAPEEKPVGPINSGVRRR